MGGLPMGTRLAIVHACTGYLYVRFPSMEVSMSALVRASALTIVVLLVSSCSGGGGGSSTGGGANATSRIFNGTFAGSAVVTSMDGDSLNAGIVITLERNGASLSGRLLVAPAVVATLSGSWGGDTA